MKTLELGWLIFLLVVLVRTLIAVVNSPDFITCAMLTALCFLSAHQAHKYEEARKK